MVKSRSGPGPKSRSNPPSKLLFSFKGVSKEDYDYEGNFEGSSGGSLRGIGGGTSKGTWRERRYVQFFRAWHRSRRTCRTYNVVRTKSSVTLTSMTTSRKFLLNIVDIWLMIRSNRVGMYNVMKFPVKGLAKLMSTKVPLLPNLSVLQNPRFLKKYLPKSSFPE